MSARGPDPVHDEPMETRVTVRFCEAYLQDLDKLGDDYFASRSAAVREAVSRLATEELD